MVQTLVWSPHPLKRPGLLLVGLLHIGVGLLLLLDAAFLHRIVPEGLIGGVVALLITLLVAATLFVPGGNRRGPGRIALVLFVVLVALTLQLVMGAVREGPRAGYPFGVVLLLVGLLLVWSSERRRRNVRIVLDDKALTVFVRRFRLEHTLPLEAVKEVSAARTFFGRIFGYGAFVARTRKGTMKDHITKPLVGEDPPGDAVRGNGWDEEERFHLVAAHPYKQVRRALENRILLAKMPPKEREEARLADRLAEDLGEMRV